MVVYSHIQKPIQINDSLTDAAAVCTHFTSRVAHLSLSTCYCSDVHTAVVSVTLLLKKATLHKHLWLRGSVIQWIVSVYGPLQLPYWVLRHSSVAVVQKRLLHCCYKRSPIMFTCLWAHVASSLGFDRGNQTGHLSSREPNQKAIACISVLCCPKGSPIMFPCLWAYVANSLGNDRETKPAIFHLWNSTLSFCIEKSAALPANTVVCNQGTSLKIEQVGKSVKTLKSH